MGPKDIEHRTYKPKVHGDAGAIERAVDMMMRAKRPVFYTAAASSTLGPRLRARCASSRR